MPTLNRTTLAVALSASDTTVRFASATGISAGDLAYIDREAIKLLYQPLPGVPTIWQVSRGISGTGAAAHAVNNQIYTGPPGWFALFQPQGAFARVPATPFINVLTGDQFVLSTGGSWQKVGDQGVPLQPAWASGSVAEYSTGGAIAIQNGQVVINSAVGRAMTLAAPTQADDGTVMTILGQGGGAHTVTAAGGFSGGGIATDQATFLATGGALTIQVISGAWRVLSSYGVTIA